MSRTNGLGLYFERALLITKGAQRPLPRESTRAGADDSASGGFVRQILLLPVKPAVGQILSR
jgi:hypothetical protein